MPIEQICVRTAPDGYGIGTAKLNNLLLKGFRVVMSNPYVVDVSGGNLICGNEYIVEREVLTPEPPKEE